MKKAMLRELQAERRRRDESMKELLSRPIPEKKPKKTKKKVK